MCWQVSIALFRGIHRLLTRQITVRTMNSTHYSSLLETIGNLSRSTTSELKSLSRCFSCRWFWKVFLSALGPVCILYTCVFLIFIYIYIYIYIFFWESLIFQLPIWYIQMLMPQSIPTIISNVSWWFLFAGPKTDLLYNLVSFCIVSCVFGFFSYKAPIL